MRKYLSPVILLFSLLLLVYTACPTIYIGDDGELDAATYTLGVGHPPGYPVFTMLSHLFTYIPLANIAYRINLLSVFFGALSVLLLLFIMKRLLDGEKNAFYAAAFTAVLLLFSETFWTQALHSKGGIYTLNLFLIFSMFLTVFNNRPYIFGLLIGLGLSNHHTVALSFPALLLLIYYQRKEWFKSGAVLKIACFAFLGVLSYLYLLFSANSNPVMNWGQPYNLERLWYHIRRGQYGDITTRPYTLTGFLDMSWVFIKWLYFELTPLLLLPVLPGIYAFYKKNRKLFYVFLLFFLTSTLGLMYVLNYEINPRNIYVNVVFFIPAFVLTAVFAGFGYFYLAEKFKYARFMLPLLLLFPLFDNIKVNNLKNNTIAYNYGTNILKSLDKDAIFFCEGDNQMFTLGYLKYVDKLRPDVTIYDELGIVFKNIYGENFLRISRRDRDALRNKLHREIVMETNRPVFIPIIGSKDSLFQDFKKEQHGILLKLVRGNPGKPLDPGKSYDLTGSKEDHTDYLLRDVLAQYYYAYGEYYLRIKDKAKAIEAYEKCGVVGYDSEWVPNNLGVVFMGMGDNERAVKYTQKSVSNSPSSARDYTNMGVIYYQQGEYDKALEFYNKALGFNPNYAEAYNGIGTVYAIRKMDGPAIKAYENAITLKPDFSEPFANMGILYHEKKQYGKAIEYYNKALALSPGNPDARNNLGVAYENMGDIDRALVEYKKATELSPSRADIRHNMGVIYYRKKMYAEALREWELVYSLKPDYPRVKENIQLVKKAMNK
ncbi:MAG: hypothetical protein A2231_12040 [Candidatus Firestonebacteria bacterium RIFOXYA2_FULL_40_8]|nr:MAG: hypothetical protein A2231_12040 [Candidatus Firestonebacteria bacterium RIFOXYA2_FULL_40_8]